MKIFTTNNFKRAAKKLYRNQIPALEDAISDIQNNPDSGELKIGDLAGVRVYKFNILHQLILLAYTYNEIANELTLVSLASYANFYENLKKRLKAKK